MSKLPVVFAAFLLGMLSFASPISAESTDADADVDAAADAGADVVVAALDDRPTALVTMGDSYISGEAGRWQGNWPSFTRDRGGTDRAAYLQDRWWRYDPSRVYGATAELCHRSDVAPALNNQIPVAAKINLACSGADTANIFRSSNGGVSHRGEAPQADQLAEVAATHDVEMIVLSVGGNDLGFADIIIDCTIRYATSPSWWKNTCRRSQQRNVDRAMESAMAGVSKAVDEIRAVMDDAGQAPGSYRLVVQSYPSPVPRGDDFRYSERGWSRSFTGGCPFWDGDATWARDSLVPQIADNLAAVAAAQGVEFLDLQDQLEGREVCSVGSTQGVGADAEWARFLSTGLTQGRARESMHPNALGQESNGTCLELLFEAAPGSYRCTNVAGSGPSKMNLES
ncbi:MAG: GDSL-type esterase/lipase family protein [Actinomycetota bacterium]